MAATEASESTGRLTICLSPQCVPHGGPLQLFSVLSLT